MFAAVIAGCKETTETPIAPSMVSNFTATPGTDDPKFKTGTEKGSIALSWQNPTEGDFFYAQIQYIDPVSGGLKKINVSHYADSYTLRGLYHKNGDYTFRIYPVSSTNTIGEQYLEVTSRSEIVPPVYTENPDSIKKIPLVADQLASNATDPSEGSLAGLLDGDLSTFWHANWHSPVPFPQYWTIKLGREVEGVKLKMTTRQHATNHAIKNAEIYGSNDPDDVSDDDATWTLLLPQDEIGTFPTGNAAVYTTPAASMYVALVPDPDYRFRRVKLNVLSVANAYWVYSELEVQSVEFMIFDPENE